MDIEKKKCTNKGKDNEIQVSVSFQKDGDSFQSIMEKILISKLTKK